ncbi:hypothetical protein M0811_06805 [Anaeramoeba ignava]|uniref:4-alpha-glucanotransferase n=1 Tax=Anaeramoeba ignava TaxID=1746090 RepID=A0A9Q0RDU3_ANAIG|nr:hypothetical protein M0811_06805 [Anaeramoeba ignava]
MLQLNFKLEHPKNLKNIYITGSPTELGGWDLQKAIQLQTSQKEINNGNLISKTSINLKQIPRNTCIEYSFFSKKNQEISFENEKNRKIKLIAFSTGNKFFNDYWGKIGKQFQSKIIIRFKTSYKTYFGQKLFLTGNCKELGMNNLNKAIEMNFINHELENWQVDVGFNFISKEKDIKFAFFIRDQNYKIITESSSRVLPIQSSVKRGFIQVSASFNGNSLPQDYIYNTSPFIKVFPKKFQMNSFVVSKIPLWESQNKKIPVHFQIIYSDELENYEIKLTGNSSSLGNFNLEKSIPLSNQNFPIWETIVWMDKEEFPIQYQYFLNPINSQNENQIENQIEKKNIIKDRIHNFQISKYYDQEFIQDPQAIFIDSGKFNLENKQNPNIKKVAGVSIPLFSLRSKKGLGVGEFTDIPILAKWAKSANFKFIQFLPVNDTRMTGTEKDANPFLISSSFALHPVYINLDQLNPPQNIMKIVEQKKMQFNKMIPNEKSKKSKKSIFKYSRFNYSEIISFKMEILKQIYQLRKEDILKNDKIHNFLAQNSFWLPAYAVYCTLSDKNSTFDFTQWKQYSKISNQEINYLLSPKSEIYEDAFFYVWLQFILDQQFSQAVKTTNSLGISLVGELPLSVNPKSADTWFYSDLFHQNHSLGLCPDYFDIRGQKWNLPVFNWKEIEKNNFEYLKRKIENLGKYFQAIRIDNISSWFRIWEVPNEFTQGIMGHFEPSIPIHKNELSSIGINDFKRLCEPYLPLHVIVSYLGKENAENMIPIYFEKDQENPELYKFKPDFDTQMKISMKMEDGELKEGLLGLLTEVCLIGKSNYENFFPRFNFHKTMSFQELDGNIQFNILKLFNQYFNERNENIWIQSGQTKLSLFTQTTEMLIIAENFSNSDSDSNSDSTFIDMVLQQMKIPQLKMERIPKEKIKSPFNNIKSFEFNSIISTSTHETENIREWWEIMENKDFYWKNILHRKKNPSYFAEVDICQQIVNQHLNSNSVICFIPIQDLFSLSPNLRIQNPKDERIFSFALNDDSQWKYQIQIPIEDLILNEKEFTNKISKMIEISGRN